MASDLTVLLTLRRAAEDEAKQALSKAASARKEAEEAQARLDLAAEETHLTLKRETQRRASAALPTGASAALSRESYRKRLAEDHTRSATNAARHKKGPLAEAHAAETAAAAAYRQARQELQALEKLRARQEAQEKWKTERRAEDADDDWVHASQGHRKRQG
jgi:hypothetical protein